MTSDEKTVVRLPNPAFERCTICDCPLHRDGEYALPTVAGRSHATGHHYVPERFFGRSANRKGVRREPMWDVCPWGYEGVVGIFCYECHEELIHNPILLPEDVSRFARLVRAHGLTEQTKASGRSLIAGRVKLFREVIARGIEATLNDLRPPEAEGTDDDGRCR